MFPQNANATDVPAFPFPSTLAAQDQCPACGQDIPPERLEEISGRIAAREQERSQAIVTELERRFKDERQAAETASEERLREQTRQSERREIDLRQQLNQEAQELVKQKIAEAERSYQANTTLLAQKVEAAELAKQTAEETKATLETRLATLQRTTDEALEVAKREAITREEKARREATELAEAANASKLEELNKRQKASEEQFQNKLSVANKAKEQAEQMLSGIESQLQEEKRKNEAELERVRKEAAESAQTIKKEATEEAEAKVRAQMEEQAQRATDAIAKATEAENKLHQSEAQRAEALAQQREILERAKDDAVNAERAKSFEEAQKFSTKISDLQRQLEKKTAEELGEGAEVNIFEALRAAFPDDKIVRIAKGMPGADIRHVVMSKGKECGTILYDSKNHAAFRNDHVTKLRADQIAANAEHAILSTHKFPQGTRQLHVQDGVLLANPARVVAVAGIVRQHMVQLHVLRLSEIERDEKVAELYDFVTSERCAGLLRRIDETTTCLFDQQEKEIRWHQNNWKRQGESYRAIQKAKVELENSIDSIIGSDTDHEDGAERTS